MSRRTTRRGPKLDLGAWSDDDDAAEMSAPFSWRLDPDVSLSDWSIRVVPGADADGEPAASSSSGASSSSAASSSNGRGQKRKRQSRDSAPAATPTAYHVHKSALAVGPRACLYFSGLFRASAHVAEGADSTSVIQMPPGANG